MRNHHALFAFASCAGLAASVAGQEITPPDFTVFALSYAYPVAHSQVLNVPGGGDVNEFLLLADGGEANGGAWHSDLYMELQAPNGTILYLGGGTGGALPPGGYDWDDLPYSGTLPPASASPAAIAATFQHPLGPVNGTWQVNFFHNYTSGDVTWSNIRIIPLVGPTGSCCIGIGTCITTTSAACTAQGGTYRGDNSSCGEPCPLPPGTWFEATDAGDLPASAQVTSGSGALNQIVGAHDIDDADMFRIRIADPANFSATTVGGADWDTTLFLFDQNGVGVVFNDDTDLGLLQSTLTSLYVGSQPAGDYYLAITRYNRRPTTGGLLIFPTTFPGEFGPDLFTPVDGWTNFAEAGGQYAIFLTGTEFSQGGGPSCYANCDLSTQAPILNVADFSCFLTKFASGDPYANCDQSTQMPTLNVADFSCFLTKFAAGCP